MKDVETLSLLRSSAASSPALSLDSKSFSIPSDWCLQPDEDDGDAEELEVEIHDSPVLELSLDTIRESSSSVQDDSGLTEEMPVDGTHSPNECTNSEAPLTEITRL